MDGYTISQINNEYLHRDTGLLIYSVKWKQNNKSGDDYPAPFEEYFANFNNSVKNNEVLFDYWDRQKTTKFKKENNSIDAKKCHIMMESTWKSDIDITHTKTPMVANEVFYHINFKEFQISNAMNNEEFKAKCKRKRPRPLGNKNQRASYSNSYVDVCINVVQSVGPPVCSNLVGEYLHYLIEDRVQKDMAGVAGSVNNIDRPPDTVVSEQETAWTKEQVARWWSIHNIQKENEFAENETQSRIVYHSKIKIEDRLAKASRLIRAMFDMFVDQTPNTELPIDADLKAKRAVEFNIPSANKPAFKTYSPNPSDHPHETLKSYADAADRTLKLDVRYIDKKQSVYDISFVNTQPSLKYWDINDEENGDGEDNDIANYVSSKLGKNVLRPDILITLYDTSQATHTRIFKMGKIVSGKKEDEALFGKTPKTLNSYAFPNLSRMCAIEIKTSRGFSSKAHKQTNHYIYDTIMSTRSTVISKYREWRFNGTVFIFHIFYDFNYAFISQVQLNEFTLLNGPESTNLKHYYSLTNQ